MVHATRRRLLGAAGALAAGVGVGARGWAAEAAAEPIRFGCISALTGAQEVLGRPILNGAAIAVDQINAAGGVLGRPLEIIAADAHADPAVAADWTRTLGGKGVNLLFGCVTSDLALAVAPRLNEANAIMITCSAATEKLTHEAFVPNLFRVTDQTYMRNRAQAWLMAERYPEIKSWGAILPDFEYGRSAWAAFHDGLLEAHAKAGTPAPTIIPPVLAKFGESNFGPQIAALQETRPEGLFIAVYGDDGLYFYRQAQNAGLLSQLRVLSDSINEFLVPMELGSSIPEHLWLASSWYFGGYQNLPMGKRLYQDYLQRTGRSLPLGFVNAGHSAIYSYAAAIAKAGSIETGRVVKALEGLTVDTAKGKVTFRAEDHQAICDVNFMRIRSRNDVMPLDIADNDRPDIEVAEFVRYDGASVIEPAAPGKPLIYRFPV